MVIYNMATTLRHNDIVSDIGREIYFQHREKVRNKSITLAEEEIALVYEGNMDEAYLHLIDIEKIQNLTQFTESVIEALRWVQPDFFMFNHDNPYTKNKSETRIAGRPNLIVEVWSEGNLQLERERKFILYSSSPITEHWYIDQYSNAVECYLGKDKLYDQTLEKVLKTLSGINIDLTHLAL